MDNAPPTTHRISEFHKWNLEKILVLAPPFQRKPIWSEKSKSYLIDTIVRGFPVPEIYVQVKTDVKGHTKYLVVDGQQRIRSILEFLDGSFKLSEKDNQEHGGSEFSELPPDVRTDFWDYQLVTRELKTKYDDEVKQVFLRLNKNVVPLNRQELRNATYDGQFISLVNRIADEDDFWADNRIVTPRDIKRMLDAEFISEIFIAMISGIQTRNHNQIDNFYRGYDQTFIDKTEWLKKFKHTETLIEEILGQDLQKTRWRRKNDFYSFFIAVFELSQTYIFPAERYDKIKKALMDFGTDVDGTIKKIISKNELAREYTKAIQEHRTNREERRTRNKILKQILIPFLIARDTKRAFTSEERRIAWALSKNKKCAICGKQVRWRTYELDHIIPHSKGGKTELSNSQITHKKCNASKSNRK